MSLVVPECLSTHVGHAFRCGCYTAAMTSSLTVCREYRATGTATTAVGAHEGKVSLPAAVLRGAFVAVEALASARDICLLDK